MTNKKNEQKCRICKNSKPITYFPIRNKYSGNRRTECRLCLNDLRKRFPCRQSNNRKERYQINKDKIKNQNKINKFKNIKKYIHKRLKYRSSERNIHFDLKVEDIPDIPEFCPILGTKLDMAAEGNSINIPSIDRFDSNLGYVKNNITIISRRSNVLKSNSTLDEIDKIINYIEKNKYESS